MNFEIKGTVFPVLEVTLNPGDTVLAESGELSWMNQHVTLRTAMTGQAGGGGVFGALKRAVAGGTLFMTEYGSDGGVALLTFAAKVPGLIAELEIGPGETYMVHRHGFLCGTSGIEFTAGLQRKLGAGIFGGVGFVMQRVGGQGHAYVELSGEVFTHELGAGETLKVHPGHLGMYTEGMGMDLVTVPGIKNKLFGGDGLFLAQLTGPGTAWLQSMPVSALAHALIPYLPTQESNG